jgi:hypothetical protein
MSAWLKLAQAFIEWIWIIHGLEGLIWLIGDDLNGGI